VIWIVTLPDEGELVIAVVKKIMPYGAFCILPEYNDLEAFIHISEVAPRWIKNIHEFISEGQRHVVSVHRVDREKNQVDISIKRVNEEEKKRKLELIRNEKRGSKLLELAMTAVKLKTDVRVIRDEIESHFPDVYTCFKEISAEGPEVMKKVDLPKALKEKIIEIAQKNIKKSVVYVDTTITFVCYGSDGINDLKKALAPQEDVTIQYLGAPKYKISLTASDYKNGQKRLDKILEGIKGFAQKNNCDFSSESG